MRAYLAAVHKALSLTIYSHELLPVSSDSQAASFLLCCCLDYFTEPKTWTEADSISWLRTSLSASDLSHWLDISL